MIPGQPRRRAPWRKPRMRPSVRYQLLRALADEYRWIEYVTTPWTARQSQPRRFNSRQ